MIEVPHQENISVFAFTQVSKLIETFQTDGFWLFYWKVQIERWWWRFGHPFRFMITFLQSTAIHQTLLLKLLFRVIFGPFQSLVRIRDKTALRILSRLIR